MPERGSGSDSWSPYVAWMKNAPPVAYDLKGSNLLHCTVEDLPGARERLELDGPHEEGYEPLCEAIARRYGTHPRQVALAAGTSGANFLVCGALLEPGCQVLVESPVYDPLLAIPRFLGAEVRRFERSFDTGFSLDPERVADAITPRTRLVILTNLHNPSGALADRGSLVAVGEVADTVGAKVLVDEVYLESVHGRAIPPAATISPTFVSTASLTKAYGLSGLRAGWVLAAPELAERVRRVRDIVDGVGVFPSELLASLAFERLPELRERARGILEPNLALLREFMDQQPGLEWTPPVGGSVGFPRIRRMTDATPFVDYLRDRFETGVVPGRFFEAPAHMRIALGGKRTILEEGLSRMAEALESKGI